ncbi:MAG TPA: class II glutamine amidotransferase [Nocardioides sp.]|jgi:glutamine amidotransferase|nr:class II glutamine amidotransferase [Nocardioides sp.]
MCRLFGLTGGTVPLRATFWLLDAPDSLDLQSSANPDGTGLGVFDAAGTPHVYKQALAADRDLDFAREARDLESTTFVGHVRKASAGAVALRNTHPFVADGRIFAHNGGFGDLGRLEEELGPDLDRVGGDTDSERLFALVTREIERLGDVTAGLVSAVDWVADRLPVHALNLVLATPHELWALRFPETHSLYVLASDAGPLTHASSAGTRVEADQAPPRVVLASERLDDDPGWSALGSGELVHVAPDLTVTRSVVRDRPPRRTSAG